MPTDRGSFLAARSTFRCYPTPRPPSIKRVTQNLGFTETWGEGTKWRGVTGGGRAVSLAWAAVGKVRRNRPEPTPPSTRRASAWTSVVAARGSIRQPTEPH